MNPNMPKARCSGLVVCVIVAREAPHGIMRDAIKRISDIACTCPPPSTSSQEDLVQHCEDLAFLGHLRYYPLLPVHSPTRYYSLQPITTCHHPLLPPPQHSPTHVDPLFVGPVGACGSVRHGRVHLSRAQPLRLRDMHLAVSAEVSPGELWKQSRAPRKDLELWLVPKWP